MGSWGLFGLKRGQYLILRLVGILSLHLPLRLQLAGLKLKFCRNFLRLQLAGQPHPAVAANRAVRIGDTLAPLVFT